ncbi:hypothetical protein QBC46DRAFT_277313 [Diplogelasinospora grovesii]|uniref:Impact N-terminal domain-containing protein n=1 Tax=Diplogelasinospora grovesii TaxID=303347 RepID=A0AAN6SA28_9PEZI|nr:hypothetical protein QBC46DRAFT_277313 [Diplogelasinospora grovesii]
MASQQDLQELLRLITVGRKTPMMQAMTQIKALQAVELRSIKQIAEAPLKTVEGAIKDDKAARALQSACKAAVKRGGTGGTPSKRATPAPSASSSKRAKYDDGFMHGGPLEMTPQELEASLELPLCLDEEKIAGTVIETNRAPLVLAFAVDLLRYTMPEQPLSSRLSLAQAVVSANSRTKAVSLGKEKGPSADEEGWGEGQPRVRVMGREVAVLKRSGYEWKGEEEVGSQLKQEGDDAEVKIESETQPETQSSSATVTFEPTPTSSWAASQPISLKKSTFIARATHISEPGQRQILIRELLNANPNLKTATHNAWAYRLRPREGGNHIREESFDDGETGCGELMLRIMREMGAVDTLVVLTRWFGGVMLGPDRWRLMRNCVTSALSERLRKTGHEVALGGEAVWGLDLEGMRSGKPPTTTGNARGGGSVVGMQIHRPEAARSYLLKAFPTAPPAETSATGKSPKKTLKAVDAEKEENLGLLLGALRLVYDSWADHLTATELDRRAWAWYVAVRPEVDHGPSGWGAKGLLPLDNILNLRRKE